MPALSPRLSVTGSKSEGGGDYVLVPFVDSMNHVTTAKTELSFSPISGDLRLSVNRCEGGPSTAFLELRS